MNLLNPMKKKSVKIHWYTHGPYIAPKNHPSYVSTKFHLEGIKNEYTHARNTWERHAYGLNSYLIYFWATIRPN